MENPEEVLQSLDEFAKLKPKDIPRELEDYLSYVAKTGDPVYQWSIVKCLFREKLLNVITDFYETSPTIDLPPCPNVDPFNYETMKNSLIERLESFPSAPFTVQRLCELLTTPRKEYSRADKFMRAIEKNILVVSTREPGNVRRSDSNGQSELLMNGVMDGRGIELGEAIETVSSDGVNMMHANETEVNVTENENVVTVECGGMEEIDMEEQNENMEASTTNAWDKEQSETTSQKEENENVEKIEVKEEEEGEDVKSKDNSDILDSAESNVENRENSVLPISAENVESSEAVCENSNSEPEAVSEENKQEVDSTETDSNVHSDTSEADEKTPKEIESTENIQNDTEVSVEKPVSEEKISSEKEAVDSSSVDDVSSNISSTETAIAVESSNDETAAETEPSEIASSVVPSTSEPVPEVTETENNSSSSDAASAETCTKDDETSEVSDSAEVTDSIVSDSVVSSSEADGVEEVTSTKSSTEDVEEVSETKEELPEQVSVQEVACPPDEAMEVDEAVSSEMPNADGEEPMDQSEQPTTEQLES